MLYADRPLPSQPFAEAPLRRRPAWPVGLARLAVVLAAYAAIASFGGFELDLLAGAETAYLARLAVAVLLAAAALAPLPARELGLGAALVTAAAWTLPRGPLRASTVAALLTGILLVAAVRRVRAEPARLAPAAAVGLAFGLQALLRGRLLFGPALATPKVLFALLALPVAAGLAAAWLGRKRGAEPAALALVAVSLFAPGWNVAATLALVTLALGDAMTDRELPRSVRVAAGVAILLPFVWEPRAAAVAAAAACVLGLRAAGVWAALAVALAGGAVTALGFVVRSPGEALSGLALFALVVPALPALAAARVEAVRLVSILLLALAAAFAVPGPAALAAPVALALLVFRPGSGGAGVQRSWLPIAGSLTALLAAYPWLRAEPLAEALGLFALAPRPATALAAVALGGLLAWGVSRLPQRATGRREPAIVVAGLAGLAVALGLPPQGRALLAGEVALSAASPRFEVGLDGARAASVVLDTHLESSAALPAGTPVAVVRLFDTTGHGPSWQLRAGDDTGEWAAERPDLAASGLVAPRPWLSWVAGDFFAHRYRAVWNLAAPAAGRRLVVERAPGLPAEVAIALHQVEIRRGATE
ncbi:MAG TPA: hypothetical protein VN783_10250 [Thermoanaerobaculia bacterium]|nr:hypothetical protein [Thermoanaerobaculia bacterium]